ncbi:MAG: YkgJ family cysteine cluster protein [Pseudomonadota bacterium]
MRSAGQDLCINCGMCCDGSLFWAVPIDAEDPAPVTRDEDGRLRQPCACFDGVCTIYAQRPGACRTFDCRVLQIVKAGHKDAKWARAQIAAMKKLVVALEAALPGDAPSVYRRAAEYIARHQAQFDDPAFQRENREVLRLLSAYEQALARFHVARGS